MGVAVLESDFSRNRFHSERKNGEAERTIFYLHLYAVDQVKQLQTNYKQKHLLLVILLPVSPKFSNQTMEKMAKWKANFLGFWEIHLGI